MRVPDGIVVWAALASADGLDWRANPGQPSSTWPHLDSEYATATYQQRGSGAQVITLPSPEMAEWRLGTPAYDRLFDNVFARLSVRAQPRST